MYSLYLRIWHRYLGRSNVLVLRSEEYASDPAATTEAALRFLGLPSPDEAAARAMDRARPRTRAPRGSSPATPLPSLPPLPPSSPACER